MEALERSAILNAYRRHSRAHSVSSARSDIRSLRVCARNSASIFHSLTCVRRNNGSVCITGLRERRRQCKLDKELSGKPLVSHFVPIRWQPPRNEPGVSAEATASPRELDSTFHRADQHQSLVSSGLLWVDAFVRFSRPHTILGTIISICSVSLLAAENVADLNAKFAIGVVQALIPALLMNVYIVGLNQLSDIEIDKVNKPYLPLASGDFSVKMGVAIVATCAALSLSLGAAVGSWPLLATLGISMLLGTAYSIELPFLRWKKVPILAAGCILAVRALVVQLGFHAHMKFVMGQASSHSRQLVFATSFMCLFSIVIALFKDIPDVEGDRVFGIRSFTVQLGQERVYWACIAILCSAYAGGVAMGLASKVLWSRVVTVISHGGLGLVLWRRAETVDMKCNKSIYETYMFVWQLFYAEYLILPFVR